MKSNEKYIIALSVYNSYQNLQNILIDIKKSSFIYGSSPDPQAFNICIYSKEYINKSSFFQVVCLDP